MEVLFTFLLQRYESQNVMITSNLVFSQWEQIFKDPLTSSSYRSNCASLLYPGNSSAGQ